MLFLHCIAHFPELFTITWIPLTIFRCFELLLFFMIKFLYVFDERVVIFKNPLANNSRA